jgi:hypothetical protein
MLKVYDPAYEDNILRKYKPFNNVSVIEMSVFNIFTDKMKEKWRAKGYRGDAKAIKEKWELIKNHTARRTFITHELKHNDALTVSALAGITPQTMKKSYDLRTKLDITMASKERRLKREAAVT